MRNVNTGQFEVYDIANNQIAGAISFGAVDLSWQVVGFGTLSTGTGSYMMMRNTSFPQTGVFQVYDISNDQITDAHSRSSARIGRLGVSPPILPPVSWGGSDGSASQLVQAMAGFDGSGAAGGLSAGVVNADTSQQTFLTTPHA
ncbi:MAG TPA: hypothetical protein VE758_05890 [Chthoniobacterales bacterium]|nr:hypothetical protein [Chthoniobacterales bacterium]